MSFSDTVSLLALIIGFLAVTMIPFAVYLEAQNKRLATAQERSEQTLSDTKKQQQLQALTLEAVSKLATASRSSQQFAEGMIHRLLSTNGGLATNSERFESSLRAFDTAIERAQKRLEMLSGDRQVQLSAFKSLAERLANIECLDAMHFVAGKDPELMSYVIHAKKRIASYSPDSNNMHQS